MLYMLDTETACAIVTARSASAAAHLRVLPACAVCISALTRAEMLHGLHDLAPNHGLVLVVDRFLKLVQALPWDTGAADWRAKMRSQSGLGSIDAMVAAHALALGAVLATIDPTRYLGLPVPLQTVDWTVERLVPCAQTFARETQMLDHMFHKESL